MLMNCRMKLSNFVTILQFCGTVDHPSYNSPATSSNSQLSTTTNSSSSFTGSPDSEDEVRIVLLGKTGVGKSATGNTILGRDAFKADLSQELVTKECQRETCGINGRNITVIDTPGLFDTELTNEEIQREISNCISMSLPGPRVHHCAQFRSTIHSRRRKISEDHPRDVW